MKAQYKTISVEYIQFTNTAENKVELDEFFGEDSYTLNEEMEPSITLDDFTEAYENDYIIKEDGGYSVYGQVEFDEMFDKLD